MISFFLTVFTVLVLGGTTPNVCAVPFGINSTHIIIGQTAPFSGLQMVYGVQLAAGLNLAFNEANAAGGVQSHNLTLFSLDDGYTPTGAVQNFATLKNETLLLIGAVGAGMNAALLPLAVDGGIPLVGSYTGLPLLRSPYFQEVVNVRVNYMDETAAQVAFMIQTLRIHRVACLYQNDIYGQGVIDGITRALRHCGITPVASANYTRNTVNVEPALEVIASAPQRAQAVVIGAFEAQSVKFISLFHKDNRTDPDCVFIFVSLSATSQIGNSIDPQYWSKLFFFQVVPSLDDPTLGIVAEFKRAAMQFMPNITQDLLALEGYVDGRFLVQVLRSIPGEISRTSFLDAVYNTRLFVLGDLIFGLYGRNFTGCDQVICASNAGLRRVFMANLNPATGAMRYDPSLPTYQYPITEQQYPVSAILRPLLFAQLLPTDDPEWQSVAEAIGKQILSAFASLNKVGGISGRPVELIQHWYSGNPAPHAAALADRYALLGFVGSVVPNTTVLQLNTSVSLFGTYETDMPATLPVFAETDLKVQASLSLELMALVAFALQVGGPVHFRAPASGEGEAALQLMVKSIHTLQQQPTSVQTYCTGASAFDGVSTGLVVAVGSDSEVQQLFFALGNAPGLRLLVPSPRAVHLLAALDVTAYAQASRFHYPFMYSSRASTTGRGVNDATAFGRLLGGMLKTLLPLTGNSSATFTTPEEVLSSWYGTVYVDGDITLGPYSMEDCNQGVHQLTVVTALRKAEPVDFTYTTSSGYVEYEDLIPPDTAAESNVWIIGVAVGGGGGAVCLLVLWWCLHRRGQRNNAAAPKKAGEPFCIIFTDIQASTHLWATIPELMAHALTDHHHIIRRAIVKHKVYEVKTIGDSFMCAAHTPQQALEFAVTVQQDLHHYDWRTECIDRTYLEHQPGGSAWGPPQKCWNGLRVRVGIHFGSGDITLDPVTKGYDYYGTVVNAAARIESVCHGGQIGVSQVVYDALGGAFPGTVWMDLGEHILRGLAEPLHLYQVLPSELEARLFPPLRLELAAREAEKHEQQRTSCTTSFRPGPEGADFPRAPSVTVSGLHWVETHPLVLDGTISSEDLLIRSHTLLRGLTTLLGTQPQRFRETALRGFCDRLHVKNHGDEGLRLQETLQGIVQRILPAAVGGSAALPSSQQSFAPVNDLRSQASRNSFNIDVNSLSPSPKRPQNHFRELLTAEDV